MTLISQYLFPLPFGCWAAAELLEIQRQVDRLPDPSSPESVGRLLQLRRQVVFLQFDAAVRHLIRWELHSVPEEWLHLVLSLVFLHQQAGMIFFFPLIL